VKIISRGLRTRVVLADDLYIMKTFIGKKAEERFRNECSVLSYLNQRGCPFVPKVLECDEETLTVKIDYCGEPFLKSKETEEYKKIIEKRIFALFEELEKVYNVKHNDKELRNANINKNGEIFIIDFELSEVIPTN